MRGVWRNIATKILSKLEDILDEIRQRYWLHSGEILKEPIILLVFH